MSKLIICSVCGGMNIQTERRPDGDRHCLDCGSRWKIGSDQESHPPTVFARITASPEVLAEKLVYWEHDDWGSGWTSNLIDEVYNTESEAIAATVAKLKEVCDE